MEEIQVSQNNPVLVIFKSDDIILMTTKHFHEPDIRYRIKI